MAPDHETPLALGAAAYIGARVDWTQPAVRGPLAVVLLIAAVAALVRLALG